MFYDKFIRLCSEKGIAPTRAAEDIGLTGGAVSYWKAKGNKIQCFAVLFCSLV